MSVSTTTITARVEAVNEKGVKLNGSWANKSKWSDENIVLPQKGDLVEATLDKDGFLRAIRPASGASPSANGASERGGCREKVITKLAILKAAAGFAAGREGIKSVDVLAIAASWERWVLSEEQAEEGGQP